MSVEESARLSVESIDVPPSTLQKNVTQATSYQYQRPESIKSWRADVGEALEDAGMASMASRWLSCSENCYTRLRPLPDVKLPPAAEKVYVCSDDHHHEAEIYSQTCDLRICPVCARRHSARLVARYLPKMQELMHSHHRSYRFRHIIFTTPYDLRGDDPKADLQRCFKLVERVMSDLMSLRHPDWRKEQGFIVTSEFGTDGLKLHFHVIHWGQYLNQAYLSSAWRQATNGDAFVVHVKGFPYTGLTIEETLQEVLKYAVKFYSKDKATGEIRALSAELLPILAKVLEGSRRVRSYGVFYNLPEPDRAVHSCQTCNAPMVGIPVDYFVTFCNTGFLPPEWRQVTEQPALSLKLADKSSSMSSGASPPGAGIQALRQVQMSWVMKMKAKDDGWGKKG